LRRLLPDQLEGWVNFACSHVGQFYVLVFNSSAMDALIAKHKGRRTGAPLLSRQALPPGDGWTSEIVDSAFRLDAERYFSDAQPFGTDHIVLLWRETLPKSCPSLDEVRSAVLSAYLADAQNMILRRNSAEWKRQIEVTMTGGRSFYDAAGLLPGVSRCRTRMYGPFTRRQKPEGLPDVVVSGLAEMPVGSVSDLLFDKENAYFVLVAGKLAQRVDPASAEYTQIKDRMMSAAANAMRAQALEGLVEAELARGVTVE